MSTVSRLDEYLGQFDSDADCIADLQIGNDAPYRIKVRTYAEGIDIVDEDDVDTCLSLGFVTMFNNQ